MCWSSVLTVMCILASAALSAGCSNIHQDVEGDSEFNEIRVGLHVAGTVEGTRSILPEETIETKITDVTLAAYDSRGKLGSVNYYDEPEGELTLSVRSGELHTIYALANMGDMSVSFPVDERSVSEMVYMLGSYENVELNGIPMCGVIRSSAGEAGKVETVQLERLFAKLNVRILHTGLKDGQTSTVYAYNLANKSIYLRQANRRLMPFAFGGSRALTDSDLLPLSDYNPDLADWNEYDGALRPSQVGPGLAYIKDTTVTLYVPENVQGCLLPGNDDPFAKTEENISDIGGVSFARLCTYLEYNASKPNKGDGYYGDLMYRCYLGEDTVTDFSIRRNCRYDLTMGFTDEGFMLDNWKVTRGDNWVDVRTLYFVDEPFVVYPGAVENVMLHYNKFSSSSDTGSTGPVSDLVYEFDEAAMSAAGLTCTFMGSETVAGKNGYKDRYFKITASSDAEVGASIPIRVSLADGSKSVQSSVYVSEIGDMSPVWDFCPQYVAQTGELVLGGVVDEFLPLSVKVSDSSVLSCSKVTDVSYRFTALKAGTADIMISNSDGSQTLNLSLNVAAPVLKVSDVDIALSPDGENGRVDYFYTDVYGNQLTNIDESVYNRCLRPVVNGCDYIAADTHDSYMDVYLNKLYSGGVLLNVGSYYKISIEAADCDDVLGHQMKAYVVDPFSRIRTVSGGTLDDYTLFGFADVPATVRNYFSDRLSEEQDIKYEIPPVDAAEIYVSSSLEPMWTGGFSYENGVYGTKYTHSDQSSSEGASLRLYRNPVYSETSHSAGRHALKLNVKNRYSGEYLSKTLAEFDVYVHTAVGAEAEFGYLICSDSQGNSGSTVAGVYNSLAGSSIYSTASSDMIYYMDVYMRYLTPVDKVYMFDRLLNDVASGSNSYDALNWLRPSRDDGEQDLKQRLMYSVCVGGGQRIVVCDEPYGQRKGIGTMLYRALGMATYSTTLTESYLKQIFLGYSSVYGGALDTFAPAYELHDMNISTDMTQNVVSKDGPYYFSPKSCASCRDDLGKGYHVVHTLNAIAPSTSGWINLL